MNLLPKHHHEFRSKEYWDTFFEQRGDEAFEWYGDYKDLRAHVIRHVSPHDKLLMLGCGNSSFSADLYDNGCTDIINVDFSETLIASMREQNLARPKMRWEVMDMTMLSFADDSFDVVFDKGALDALLSVDEPLLLQKAEDMFAHISRVLLPGGKVRILLLDELSAVRESREFSALHQRTELFHDCVLYFLL